MAPVPGIQHVNVNIPAHQVGRKKVRQWGIAGSPVQPRDNTICPFSSDHRQKTDPQKQPLFITPLPESVFLMLSSAQRPHCFVVLTEEMKSEWNLNQSKRGQEMERHDKVRERKERQKEKWRARKKCGKYSEGVPTIFLDQQIKQQRWADNKGNGSEGQNRKYILLIFYFTL